jgi:predicted ATPase
MVEQQLALSGEYGLAYWQEFAAFIGGFAEAHRGSLTAGIAIMRLAIDRMSALGARVGVPYLLCTLAEAQLEAGHLDPARAALSDASRLATRSGNALYAAEARRLQGLLARAGHGGPTGRRAARPHLEAALRIARAQGTRALELRAATSLARLRAEDGDARGALQVLAPVRESFVDGSETLDLARADELLSSLRDPHPLAERVRVGTHDA